MDRVASREKLVVTFAVAVAALLWCGAQAAVMAQPGGRPPWPPRPSKPRPECTPTPTPREVATAARRLPGATRMAAPAPPSAAPGAAELLAAKSRELNGKGQYDDAIRAATDAITLNPRHVSAYIFRADAYS